ncbi:MAG: hypothetical protein LUC26_06555 [Prevotella sp.]|nr:hypothetical protein [Prevotella sp.]
MKKYIKPDTLTLNVDPAFSALDNGNTYYDFDDHAKGTDEWLPEEEIDDDEWW